MANGEDARRPRRAEGTDEADASRPTTGRGGGKGSRRASPAEYLREVRGEMRKVAWPSRGEVVNYTIVVLVATAFLMAITFGFDFIFGRLVFTIFG